MTKGRTRINLKRRNYKKDKGVFKFILQHLVKEEIDLSKVPIPSFSDILKSDEEESRAFRAKYLNSKLEKSNSEKSKEIPTFTLSLLDIIKGEENSLPKVNFSTTLFKFVK